MKFTRFNKAITATVMMALIVLSVVFKTDLSGYGDIVTSVLAIATPYLVYRIPNLAVLADGANPDVEKVEDVIATVAGAVAGRLKT